MHLRRAAILPLLAISVFPAGALAQTISPGGIVNIAGFQAPVAPRIGDRDPWNQLGCGSHVSRRASSSHHYWRRISPGERDAGGLRSYDSES